MSSHHSSPATVQDDDSSTMIVDEMADISFSSTTRPFMSTPPRSTDPESDSTCSSPSKFSWSGLRGRRSVAPMNDTASRTTPSPSMPTWTEPNAQESRCMPDPVASTLLLSADDAAPLKVHAKPPKVPRPRAIRPQR